MMGNDNLTDKIDTGEGEKKNAQEVPHPLNTVDSFIPKKENIAEKGNLKPPQTVQFSLAKELYRPYKEFLSDKSWEMIENFVDQVERRQISVRGQSRDEITKIFSSIFQSYHMEESDENGPGNVVQKIFDAQKGGD